METVHNHFGPFRFRTCGPSIFDKYPLRIFHILSKLTPLMSAVSGNRSVDFLVTNIRQGSKFNRVNKILTPFAGTLQSQKFDYHIPALVITD